MGIIDANYTLPENPHGYHLYKIDITKNEEFYIGFPDFGIFLRH